MIAPRAFLASLEQIGIKLGLDQIRGLVDGLGRPDRAFRSLVVAGTNGKGSVTAMVERGLRAAGYRTGRYTSPHLVDLEERFAIDGASLAPSALEASAARVQQAAAALPAPPSFFEATTALALDAFRTAGVDVAVLEVGLGGRLDATNVVTPVAVAITRVDFDHEQFLGHTLEAIAREKAGIIKPGRPVVLGDNPPAVTQVVTETCARVGARLVRAPDGVAGRARMVDGRARLTLDTPQRGYGTLTLGLRGRHQVENAIVAVRVLEEVSTLPDFDVSSTAITTAVEEVVWPGRLELLREGTGREVLLDGAHNPSGARALAAYLAETYARPLPIVLGAMRDKDLEALVAALAPAALALLCTAPASGRAARPADLATVAARVAPEVPVEVMADPMAAVARAAALGSPAVVAGSLYLAGEIRAHLS